MTLKHPPSKWLGILLLVLLPWLASAQSKEYQIKAAFLFNFAQFVQWPAAAFADTNAPFRIGILGEDPFGSALAETVQGESIDNHKIIITRSQHLEDLQACQMIFIGKSEKSRVPEVLTALDSKPILKVGETPGFVEHGGSINFYLDGNKVRFEICPDKARVDGLKISSQLLSVGKIVEARKEDKP